MKATKTLTFLLAALTMTACSYDDSELRNQINQNTERIAALEAWQAETNTNIQSLQTLLNTTDYITAVTPIVENGVEVGYTISFLNSPAITIYHGKNGDKGDKGENGITPQIGVTQGGDGNWYWTLNSELMTDEQGNPIRANGETGATGASAPAPQLATGANLTNVTTDTQGNAIAPDAIYLSVDDGRNWTRVSGEKGGNFFSSIDTTNPTQVTFILADGAIFSIPRYTSIKLTFSQDSIQLLYGTDTEINFTAEGSTQFTLDNLYTVTPDGWKVSIALTRTTNTAFTMTVTAPADAESGTADGEILVMLNNGQGNTTIGRVKVTAVKYTIENNAEGSLLTATSLQPGELATAIGNRSRLDNITVTSGSINEADWAAIKNNYRHLKVLDLAGATYTGTDSNSIIYSNGNLSPGEPSLVNIKLPQGITGLGDKAFYHSDLLISVTLPDGLTSIGKRAFQYSFNLALINLPDGLTSIGENAFYRTSLSTITIPKEVTSIGSEAFYDCSDLNTVTCLASNPPTLGVDIFLDCETLTSIYVPATSVDSYKAAENWSTWADKIVAIEP